MDLDNLKDQAGSMLGGLGDKVKGMTDGLDKSKIGETVDGLVEKLPDNIEEKVSGVVEGLEDKLGIQDDN